MFTDISSNKLNDTDTETELTNNVVQSSYNNNNENNYNALDRLLEKEKISNKLDNWNKIDKTVKTQKLHQFAERYGKEHNLPTKDIKALKFFFVNSLEKNKLKKTKDVVYNKDTGEITSIPALHFNSSSHSFTLRIIDTKRVSTLKSLTPKRLAEKEHVD